MVTRQHLNTFTKGARVNEASTSMLRWWCFRLSNGNYVFNIINSANHAPRTKEIGFTDFLLNSRPRRKEVIKVIRILSISNDLFSLGNVISISILLFGTPLFLVLICKKIFSLLF